MEISIGPKNDVWILSGVVKNRRGKEDYKIYKNFKQVVGKARKITIDKDGDPWIVMSN